MKQKPMDNKTLKYFARMAAESYVNDPVHAYVTKSEKLRKKFVYHFMIERLATSNREDIIYIDEEKLKEAGAQPIGIEGRATGWVLLDYGSVVVNVMDAKNRDFYGLDHTWNDGKELDVSDYIKD